MKKEIRSQSASPCRIDPLEGITDEEFYDAAYTLSARRAQLPQRWGAVCASRKGAIAALTAADIAAGRGGAGDIGAFAGQHPGLHRGGASGHHRHHHEHRRDGRRRQ